MKEGSTSDASLARFSVRHFMGGYNIMFFRILTILKNKIQKSRQWLNKNNQPKYLSGKNKGCSERDKG